MSEQLPQEARDDFNVILEFLLPFAEQMLRKHGEFYPFGAVVTAEGELVPRTTEEKAGMPESEQVLADLVCGFQADSNSGKIRAAGTCHDGRVVQEDKKVDAIIVNLEHVRGGACKGYLPYKKGLFGKLHLGELAMGRVEPVIW